MNSDRRLMTRAELLAALKKAPRVFVWVNLTGQDGTYFRVSKGDVKYRVTLDVDIEDGEAVILAFADEESHALYIN
jgi:hypothetical protein